MATLLEEILPLYWKAYKEGCLSEDELQALQVQLQMSEEELVSFKTGSNSCPACKDTFKPLRGVDGKVRCARCGWVLRAPEREPEEGEEAAKLAIEVIEPDAVAESTPGSWHPCQELEKDTLENPWTYPTRGWKCSHCGALWATHQAELSTCPLCQHPLEAAEKPPWPQPDASMMRLSSEAQVRSSLLDWAVQFKSSPEWIDKIEKATLSPVYLPYWLYQGQVKVTTQSRITRHFRERNRYQYFSDTFQNDYLNYWVPAGSGPILALLSRLPHPDPGRLIELSEANLQELPLGCDASRGAQSWKIADARVRDVAATQARTLVKGELMKLNTEYLNREFKLVAAPYWLLSYEEGGQNYWALAPDWAPDKVVGTSPFKLPTRQTFSNSDRIWQFLAIGVMPLLALILICLLWPHQPYGTAGIILILMLVVIVFFTIPASWKPQALGDRTQDIW